MSMLIREATSELDRLWFEEHPGSRCYLRRYVPGEYGPARPVSANHILVIEMFPGARMRHPLSVFTEDEDRVPAELFWIDTGERWTVLPSGQVVPKSPTKREAWQALLTPDLVRLVEANRAAHQARGRS